MHLESKTYSTVTGKPVFGCCHKASNITLLSADRQLAHPSGSSAQTAWQKLSARALTCWYESWKTWPLLTVTGSTFLPFLPTTARRSGPTSCLAARAAISLHNEKALRPGREGGQPSVEERRDEQTKSSNCPDPSFVRLLEGARRRGEQTSYMCRLRPKQWTGRQKSDHCWFSNGWKG
jgi:hypothetical protein